jgi:sigma-B regulation protein RsbU (phosphoserine phosphatase)
LILNNAEKKIEYSGAGDLAVLRLEAKNKEVIEYTSEGMLLGLLPDGEYNNIEINLNSDDEVYLFTDGIVESRNKEGAQFGIESVKNIITSNPKDKDGLDNLKDKFSEFTDNDFEDDITVIKINIL